MNTYPTSRGFTFVEILVAISVIFIISTISFVSMQNMNHRAARKVSTEEIKRAFADARNNTLASKGDTVFGVYTSTSSVTRFVGSVYTENEITNTVYTFERGVTATGTLVSNNVPVVFSRLTGEPSATGTIFVFLEGEEDVASSTIVIHESGLVE